MDNETTVGPEGATRTPVRAKTDNRSLAMVCGEVGAQAGSTHAATPILVAAKPVLLITGNVLAGRWHVTAGEADSASFGVPFLKDKGFVVAIWTVSQRIFISFVETGVAADAELVEDVKLRRLFRARRVPAKRAANIASSHERILHTRGANDDLSVVRLVAVKERTNFHHAPDREALELR